ncbi:MAG: hypothetical protein IT432_15720 [Phycisphaerales bacterium]|nr:hypothetical protein [Phycisphaerales bacterium]
MFLRNCHAFPVSLILHVARAARSFRTALTLALITLSAWSTNTATAQTNIAGAYVDGQVFLRWDLAAGFVFTYDLYSSDLPQTDIANMTLLARIFPEEAVGERMQNLKATATLRVPNGSGYTTLTATQGAMAWTPHEDGAKFFAVVVHGNTGVTTDNRVYVNYGYDPVNEPVRPHLQFGDVNAAGYPYAAYMVWVDGREDPEDGRPDFPVMASASRGCVPHVFAVTSPLTGLPPGPYPAVFCMHGGEGQYQAFMPGMHVRANMSLEMTSGILITPDDNLYWQGGPNRQSSVTSWFGYARHFDPFFIGARGDVPNDEIITNYTSRRVFWFADWLTSGAGPFNVDPHRVAIIGHSAGSRGASHLSRQQPWRFSAVVLQCALFNFNDTPPYYGLWSQNLATNVLSPDTGLPLTHQQVQTQSVRLSPESYVPYTRLYSGKRDDNMSGAWTPIARAGLDACNDSELGLIVSWDEREHSPEEWSHETPDLGDDATHCDPWPDLGQWISPVKTDRHSAQYLADCFRNDVSYPGFFDSDEDLATPGRQPDPGSGDPCSPEGAAWGTWGGYLDWTPASILDHADRWECTIFLRGNSAVTVDNAPVPVVRVSIAPRRTQEFHPSAGQTVYWALRVPENGPVTQHGQVIADSIGVPKVSALLIPREDLAKARLILGLAPQCPADFNHDGFVNALDYDLFAELFEAGDIGADFNHDGFTNALDYDDFAEHFEAGC